MTRPLSSLLVLCTALSASGFAQPPPTDAAPVRLAEVVVSPSQFGIAEQPATAAATLTSAELQTLPQIGDDLYRSIARLPGLAADDFSARFWVRGAPNAQLLARFDGVDLIEPFHLKDVDGVLSIVDPAALSHLNLVTGGFTAEAGDRLAGVLTMESKSNPPPQFMLALSLTSVGGLTQGRADEGRAGWLVSARRGYPDIALRIDHREDEVDPRYYDATAKFEYRVAPGQVLSVHVLHAGDTLRYHRKNDPTLRSAYDSDYLWLRWVAGFGPNVREETVLSGTRLTWSRDGSGVLDGFPFALRDHRRYDVAALRQDWEITLGDRALWRAGYEARAGAARYDYALSHQFTAVSNGQQAVITDATASALSPRGDSVGGYTSLRLRAAPELVLEPGLRFDRHAYAGDADWSPRLNAGWEVAGMTVRAAWGRYAQSEGLYELDPADGDTRFHRAEHAEQRVVGIERRLGKDTSLRVEAYERITRDVRPRWQNLDNPYDLFPEAQTDRVLLAPAQSRARGLEWLLSGHPGPTWAWNASYALSRTEDRLAQRWVPRARDQRHALYADVTYAPSVRWQFSAAWQYHTGWPTTDVSHALVTLNNGRRVLVASNGAPYGLRMPDYHRLDLRATRRFALRHGQLRTFIDLFNVYDRRNVIGYDHQVTVAGATVTDLKKPREQLPFLPSAGVSWEL